MEIIVGIGQSMIQGWQNNPQVTIEGTLFIDDALNAFSVDSIVAAKENTNGKQIFGEILVIKKSRRLSDSIIF